MASRQCLLESSLLGGAQDQRSLNRRERRGRALPWHNVVRGCATGRSVVHRCGAGASNRLTSVLTVTNTMSESLDVSTLKDDDKDPLHAVATREEDIQLGKDCLLTRLATLQLREVQMMDDGNCQFAAFSHQMYRTQKYHRVIRRKAVEQILHHREMYLEFFDGEEDLERYARGMKRDGDWGDEITLKAVCDYFDVVIHVVLSTEGTWYLRYSPTHIQSKDGKQGQRHLFLSYLYPIHYNSIVPIKEPTVPE
eukprot:NODE_4963_length_996_cov_101.190149_g4756_i0.p1 GENE.NODE_4963_length_996_cov_101.190149_g4756_i0~~NODE_4963_length_996_cov_101.190149_g4756_i0.p1  ORF type:complete len:252 (-),score=26.59 NODE_4963_length_996_cov_101.190149_g4756_i0:110-865(-)